MRCLADDATGNPIHTCAENAELCPDKKTLQNMKTMSIWAEGVEGEVHLEIKSISGYNCAAPSVEPVAAEAEAPCCKVCDAPEVKYFSVDVPHGFCGETCLKPSLFPVFKVFESNLTLYNGTGPSPCAEQYTPFGTHYTIYNGTVTHGVWPLTCTLDLYAPEPK